MTKTVFYLKNSKTIFSFFSSVFAFEQAKEQILFKGATFKNVIKKNYVILG